MSYCQGQYSVVKKEMLASGTAGLWVSCPQVAAVAEPGQFVHIKCGGYFLRRPISICEIDRVGGAIRLVVEQRGNGTAILAGYEEGDCLDMLAPLGRGWTLLDRSEPVVCVGGGIGLPPLLGVARYYGAAAVVMAGFRSREAVILNGDFTSCAAAFEVSTDDGSMGYHGLVTDLFAERLEAGPPVIVYACGPKAMLKAVKALCTQAGVRCEISLEEHMGCGVGACLVCACKKSGGGYARVCKDGPVFPAEEVCLDD